jgi:hypothetical protein
MYCCSLSTETLYEAWMFSGEGGLSRSTVGVDLFAMSCKVVKVRKAYTRYRCLVRRAVCSGSQTMWMCLLLPTEYRRAVRSIHCLVKRLIPLEHLTVPLMTEKLSAHTIEVGVNITSNHTTLIDSPDDQRLTKTTTTSGEVTRD